MRPDGLQVLMASSPESIQRVGAEEAGVMLGAVDKALAVLLEGRVAELLLLQSSKSHTARLCQGLMQRASQEAKLRRCNPFPLRYSKHACRRQHANEQCSQSPCLASPLQSSSLGPQQETNWLAVSCHAKPYHNRHQSESPMVSSCKQQELGTPWAQALSTDASGTLIIWSCKPHSISAAEATGALVIPPQLHASKLQCPPANLA